MFRYIKSQKIKLLTYVMALFIFIIIMFGSVNVYKSCNIIRNQANANFMYIARDIKKSQNDYFSMAEKETEYCKKLIELSIDDKKLQQIEPIAYKYNKYKIPYMGNYLKNVVSPLLLYSKNQIEGLVSIYFIFDMERFKHKDLLGLWYTDTKLTGNFQLTDNGPITDMYPADQPELLWFYAPKKFNKGLWSVPYVDNDIKIDMITYSTPVYSNGHFAGVLGIDLSMEGIKKFIHKFTLYKTGKIYLIDKNNEIIFAKDYKSSASTRVIDRNLYNYLNGPYQNESINLKADEIKLVKSLSGKRLFAITTLQNDFVLVLDVPVSELYAETDKLLVFTFYSLILAVLIALLIAIEAYAKIKRINNELIHKEKLISMGTMAAKMAHEINNPLGYINCNIDTLKKFLEKMESYMVSCDTEFNKVITQEAKLEEEMVKVLELREEFKIDYILSSLNEIIEESQDGIKRVSDIVTSLKNFSKDDSNGNKLEENLEQIIEETLMMMNNKKEYDVEIIKSFEHIEPILCNKNQLKQVFVNIIDNAYHALKEKGHNDKKIIISIFKKNEKFSKNAYVSIEDNGIGIEKNKIDKIFNSFYTTKAYGEGTGLGLSIAKEIIINKHKGEIHVDSKKTKGTKFTIKIPYKQK